MHSPDHLEPARVVPIVLGKIRMRILVTNDDGIYSPGILALAHAAARFGNVRMVAPDVEQSSMAFAVTATRPLRHRHASIAGFDAFRVDGTPADCVALGTHIWGNVDVVFSGVNLGLNVGHAMWHSGTLAAAKQAVLLGMRGIAFSAPPIDGVSDYAPILPWLERVIAGLLRMQNTPLLNVNFPADPRGIEWTRQSVRLYDGRVIPTRDPMGGDVFWFAPMPRGEPEPGTDRHAVEAGLVSITPLRLDLTDEPTLEKLSSSHARFA
jgi:5'-nucleotidase